MGPMGNGYYFGNYYGPSYYRIGYRPWFGGGWGNPLESWRHWVHRRNIAWLAGLQSVYRGRYNGTMPCPPLTLAQQNILLNKSVNTQNNTFNNLRMVQPLGQFNGVRLTRLNAAQIAGYRNAARNFHQLGLRRQSLQGIALRGGTRGTLPLNHLISRGTLPSVRPIPAIAPRSGGSGVIAANHAIGRPAVHPLPRVPVNHAVASHPRPAPAVHHAAPAAVHHAAPAVHHTAPAVHHAAPAVHHAAPVHRAAPASHGGGGHRR
jgi:hypothetical protein